MGISNFKKSLEQRYSALTGELQVVHASIARIRREEAGVPYRGVPALEAHMQTATIVVEAPLSVAPEYIA